MYVPALQPCHSRNILIQGPTERYRYANITLCEAVTTGATNQNLGSAKNATICPLSCNVVFDDSSVSSWGRQTRLKERWQERKKGKQDKTLCATEAMLIANPMGLVATMPPIPPVRHSLGWTQAAFRRQPFRNMLKVLRHKAARTDLSGKGLGKDQMSDAVENAK